MPLYPGTPDQYQAAFNQDLSLRASDYLAKANALSMASWWSNLAGTQLNDAINRLTSKNAAWKQAFINKYGMTAPETSLAGNFINLTVLPAYKLSDPSSVMNFNSVDQVRSSLGLDAQIPDSSPAFGDYQFLINDFLPLVTDGGTKYQTYLTKGNAANLAQHNLDQSVADTKTWLNQVVNDGVLQNVMTVDTFVTKAQNGELAPIPSSVALPTVLPLPVPTYPVPDLGPAPAVAVPPPQPDPTVVQVVMPPPAPPIAPPTVALVNPQVTIDQAPPAILQYPPNPPSPPIVVAPAPTDHPLATPVVVQPPPVQPPSPIPVPSTPPQPQSQKLLEFIGTHALALSWPKLSPTELRGQVFSPKQDMYLTEIDAWVAGPDMYSNRNSDYPKTVLNLYEFDRSLNAPPPNSTPIAQSNSQGLFTFDKTLFNLPGIQGGVQLVPWSFQNPIFLSQNKKYAWVPQGPGSAADGKYQVYISSTPYPGNPSIVSQDNGQTWSSASLPFWAWQVYGFLPDTSMTASNGGSTSSGLSLSDAISYQDPNAEPLTPAEAALVNSTNAIANQNQPAAKPTNLAIPIGAAIILLLLLRR